MCTCDRVSKDLAMVEVFILVLLVAVSEPGRSRSKEGVRDRHTGADRRRAATCKPIIEFV